MRPKMSVLTLLRSPLKTAITFLLLAATSFAFVSRGAEYAATVAEIEKAEAAYTAVGTLQRSTEGYYEYMENLLGEEVYELEGGTYIDRLSNATAPLEQEVVDLVLGSEYIAQDEFIMVAGGLTSENLTNITEQPLHDILGYSEWNWMPLDGTFAMADAWVIATLHYRGFGQTSLGNFIVEDVLLGDEPALWREDMRFSATDDIFMFEQNLDFYEQNRMLDGQFDSTGHRFLVAVRRYSGDTICFFNPAVDYPLVDLSRLEEEYGLTDWTEALRDPEKYGLIPYENASGEDTVPVLEYMATLYRNFHTQELVYTDDMAGIVKYHAGDLYISDGRAITANDTGLVCVVSTEYAAKNGLAVGDRIDFSVDADTMVHSAKVFAREVPAAKQSTKWAKLGMQRFSDRGLEPVTQTYEIVGIWSDSTYEVSDPYSYSPNSVFVPYDTYPWPGEVEPTLLPSTFSFTLNHPGDMAKIEAELGDTLAALGYELSINDMGYAAAKPSLDFMKLSALIGFAAMSLALLLSLILITYLFIIRKKRDYAIMRALGTPVPRANRSLLTGLFTLAFTAVFLGSAAALIVTQNFAADLSAQISEITGSATASTMPAWLIGAFGAGVLGLLLIFARIGLVRISRTPPLMLLQGGK